MQTKDAQEMMDSMTQNAKNSGLDFHLLSIPSMLTDFYTWLRSIISQMN
jgi:hypothetical protein